MQSPCLLQAALYLDEPLVRVVALERALYAQRV